MKRIISGFLAFGGMTVSLLCLAADVPTAHQTITSYEGSQTCTYCHLQKAGTMMATTHWTWEHTDPVTGRQYGKNKVINNYCVAVPSNEPRCTSCHVGVGYKDKNFDFNDASKVDCLACHDTTGTYKKFPTMAGAPWTGPGTNVFGGVAYPPVDLLLVAKNAGKTSRATCGACHFYGGGGDAVKHGDLDSTLKNPDRTLDVHMGVNGGNFACATCHRPSVGYGHQILGTYYTHDPEDPLSCQMCHTTTPHTNSAAAAQLNHHSARVGCQTCHIPQFARGRTTTMTWDWSTAGVKTNGQNFVIKDANGDPIYDTQKGTFTWASNVIPQYVWFNGQVDYMTVDDVIDPTQRVKMNTLHGDVSDSNARIMPAKRFTGRQPYDAGNNVVAVPNLFPNDAGDTNAYWKTFNWTNAIASGMAYVGEPFSGQVGWVDTEFYWIENHMVAPKENALSCAHCHTETGGRLDYAALGYSSNQVAFLQSTKPWLGSDHAGRFPTGYTNSTSCTVCHNDSATEVMHTSHWTWEHTDSVTGRQYGKNKVINNYCVSVAANEPRCTSCHVGVGYKDKTFNFADASKVDCLACHDTTATYKKFPTMAGAPWTGPGTNVFGGTPYPPVDLAFVASNVGKTSRNTCGACHFYGGGGDAVKHGDLDSTLKNPDRSLDVHMGVNGGNFTCAKCHKPAEGTHEIPGTYYTKDHADSQSCESCHTAAPHKDSDLAQRLNLHTGRVGCQSCHIPAFARGRTTTMTWDWSTAGVKTNGQNFVVKDANGDTIYDTQKGTFTWASNVIPQYVWFNGQVDYMTVDDVIDPTQRVKMNTLHGDASDPKARILPVKRFTGRQPYDAGNNVVAVPNLFANDATDTNAYWKTFNWTNAIASGMAYAGKPFSGQVGWVDTEFYWIENHMVAPKENAVGCAECHTDSGGRLDFAALGYEADRAARLQDLSLMTGADHRGRFGSNYLGAASCVQCHPNQVNEVMASTHYLWRTPNPKLAFPGGGSHGMIDRFCGLVGSSAMVNYFADLGNYKDSSACGKCHVGDSLPFPSPATGQFTQQQKDNVDCLICHATEGNYDMDANSVYDANDAEATHRLLMTDAQSGRRFWFQDKSLRAAESVGLQVDTASCLRCHEHGQADPSYKRGTPFNPEHDAHAAAGMTCTDCHLVDQHKMARGSRVTDMHAWERQDVEVDCVRCHTDRPHPESAANPEMQARNDHAAYLACETCHIPVTSGASRRIWTSTFGVTNGPEASVPALNPQTGMYQPYSDYTADYVARPAYRWFNGSVSMLAEPMHDASAWDFRIADKTTPGAKIYPFRPIVNGMVMDRRGFGYDPNYNTNFTMAAAMDMMAGPMKMMGFMRPEGLSDRERAVLMQFPNLVNFDKETYVKTGNAREAVNVGLGRLGMLMGGQDPWLMPDAVLSGIGSNFWSGDLLGLDLPNNPMDPTYNPAGDPTKPTGSFVSLSHAIKRNGLACADCHSATGVMDFNALKYSPDEAQRLATLLNRVELSTPTPTSTGLQLRWSTVPGRIYAVEATADLGSGQWWTVRSATNATAQWDEYEAPNSLLNTNRQLFFRVREVTP